MFSVILYDIILVYSTIFIDITDELKKSLVYFVSIFNCIDSIGNHPSFICKTLFICKFQNVVLF